MTRLALGRFAPGGRSLRVLAALACLLVWTQLAAASHLHEHVRSTGDHSSSTCELCVAHGASAPPPAGPVAACTLPTPIETLRAQATPAATPARHTPHAPRAPPVRHPD